MIRLRPRTFSNVAPNPAGSASADFQPFSVFGIVAVAFARSCSFLFLQPLPKFEIVGVAIAPVFPVILPIGVAFPAL